MQTMPMNSWIQRYDAGRVVIFNALAYVSFAIESSTENAGQLELPAGLKYGFHFASAADGRRCNGAFLVVVLQRNGQVNEILRRPTH